MKELSGPTKGATEAACRPVPKRRNGGKVELILSSGNDTYSRNKRRHRHRSKYRGRFVQGCIKYNNNNNISSDDSLTSSAFRGCQPITYKWLSWRLLDAVGPVLLRRSGILQKGLLYSGNPTLQWSSIQRWVAFYFRLNEAILLNRLCTICKSAKFQLLSNTLLINT